MAVTGPDGKVYAIELAEGYNVILRSLEDDEVSTEPFTMAMWYRRTGDPEDSIGSQFIWSWDNLDIPGPYDVYLSMDDGGFHELELGWYETGFGFGTMHPPDEWPNVMDGEWHFMAVRFEADGEVMLQLDTDRITLTEFRGYKNEALPIRGGGQWLGLAQGVSPPYHNGFEYYDFRLYLKEVSNEDLDALHDDMTSNEGNDTLPPV